MANVSGKAVDETVAVKMTTTALRAEVNGIRLESSMARANRLIREHRERVNQPVSAAAPLGE